MNALDQYPELIPNTNLDLLAKQVVEGFVTGLHKSPFHGFSVEFSEHKAYQQGENTKAIDWKLYARSDKMFIKRFEEETNLRCQMVLDTSASMYYPNAKWNKIKYSSVAIAALSNLLKQQRDAFGLTTFSEELQFHSPCKSTSTHQKIIFAELERCMQSKPAMGVGNIAASLHELAEKIHRRSLVIIFTDLLDSQGDTEALFSSLQHLRYNKHEVIIFHISDSQTELDFNFEDRPYLFVDMETGEETKLHANAMRTKYRESVSEYFDKIQERCLQEKIDLVRIDLQKGFNDLLISYLIKRKMRRKA
jgi:uncharacterized protein (DUF58 family)